MGTLISIVFDSCALVMLLSAETRKRLLLFLREFGEIELQLSAIRKRLSQVHSDELIASFVSLCTAERRATRTQKAPLSPPLRSLATASADFMSHRAGPAHVHAYLRTYSARQHSMLTCAAIVKQYDADRDGAWDFVEFVRAAF